MSKKSTPVVNLGSSSMLVIFIILCLVTFAVLSLASANSDYRYSKKLEERTTAYYEASNQAEEMLGRIDAVLKDSWDTESQTYAGTLSEALEQLSTESISVGLDSSAVTPVITYTVPMNDSFALSVSLGLLFPKDQESAHCEILSWQEISTGAWTPDTKLNLIQ